MNQMQDPNDAMTPAPTFERCACVCGESATTGRRILGRDEVHGGTFTYEACAQCRTERVLPRPARQDIGHYYPNTYYAYSGPIAPPVSRSDQFKRVVADDELSRLLTFPNVLITAHQAFLTGEALSEIARVTTANLLQFETGEPFLAGTTL